MAANTKMDNNILGTESIPRLILKFGVPSVISMVVNSIYNLVDQIFIGQGVGYLGNAATNVTMPFVTIAMAISMMIAVGTAANVGLNLGRKNQDLADNTLGNGLTLALVSGTLVMLFGQAFLIPMLKLFGATENILPYAIDYARIYLIGTVFTTIGIVCSDAVRTDGNPRLAMIGMLTGAVINIICDPLFIFVFKWGVKGAAIATIMGQFATMVLMVAQLPRLKTINFKFENMKLKSEIVMNILKLGFSMFVTQCAALIMQIIMNQQTKKYGELSKYGADIPLTVFGIVMKVNGLMMSVIMGITGSSQPIFSYNYGAGNFKRVKQLVKTLIIVCSTIGVVGMLCFQLFPSQIIAIFGQADELYNEFAVTCLKTMTVFIFVMSIQMVSGTFFQATGQPVKATILSLSRQVLFSIPCLLILPIFFGINGVMLTFPVSDVFSVALAAVMLSGAMKKLNVTIKERESQGLNC